MRARQRIPEVLQSALRKKQADLKASKLEDKKGASRAGSFLKSGLKSMFSSGMEAHSCEICEGEMRQEKKMKNMIYIG